MRVCFLTATGSIHDQRLLKSLAKRGHEVHVITLHPPKALDGVQLHHLTAPITRYSDVAFLFNYSRIRRLLDSINPDVVAGLGLSNYGFYAAVCGRRPLAVSAYGSDVLLAPKESLRLKWMVKYAIKKADLITADAEVLKKEIMRLGGEESKVVVQPLGVDDVFLSVNRSREFARKDRYTVLSYRSLEPLYNIELILQAFPLVVEQTAKVKLIIAGEGSQRSKLEEMASQLGIENKTQFMGAVAHDELPKVLESADVYVSMSLSDSTSVSLLEAMAAGVFPIVSDIPGNREWVENRVNGFTVPTDDPRLLAKRIVQAVEDDSLRRSAAQKNLEIITAKARWNENIDRLEAAFLRLAGDKRS